MSIGNIRLVSGKMTKSGYVRFKKTARVTATKSVMACGKCPCKKACTRINMMGNIQSGFCDKVRKRDGQLYMGDAVGYIKRTAENLAFIKNAVNMVRYLK